MDGQHYCEQGEFCNASYTDDDGDVFCCDCGGLCYSSEDDDLTDISNHSCTHCGEDAAYLIISTGGTVGVCEACG